LDFGGRYSAGYHPAWFLQVPVKPRFTVFSETISVLRDMARKADVKCRIPDNSLYYSSGQTKENAIKRKTRADSPLTAQIHSRL
jgi:hypothetical protein